VFLGHFAIAFAAKRAAPRASLAATFAAAQLADILWPVFLLLGWEHVTIQRNADPFLNLTFTSYPWSHSLVMDAVWGLAFGLIAYALLRDAKAAVVLGLLVLSHWVLDVAVHVPDMPLTPGGGAKIGLGLWRWPVATVMVEAIMFIAGVGIYARGTSARDAIGRWGLWSLVAFLAVIYAASLISGPPPSVTAVAWAGFAFWILVLWAWWADQHRATR
jgi:hypothetical protein